MRSRTEGQGGHSTGHREEGAEGCQRADNESSHTNTCVNRLDVGVLLGDKAFPQGRGPQWDSALEPQEEWNHNPASPLHSVESLPFDIH